MPLAVAPLCFASQVVITCVLTQMNYLNKALDLYNTAVVSPVYYVMFTVLTIIASVLLFQVCVRGRVSVRPVHTSYLCCCWDV